MPQALSFLASIVLLLHVAIIVFNGFGLVAIPVGAWRNWRFVRIFWWRALHMGLMVIVAVQALFGRACILTVWQYSLEKRTLDFAGPEPMIQRWVEALIFWPLPPWVFAVAYTLLLIYAGLLWRWVPPKRCRRL